MDAGAANGALSLLVGDAPPKAPTKSDRQPHPDVFTEAKLLSAKFDAIAAKIDDKFGSGTRRTR
jgi:hypothetical protein